MKIVVRAGVRSNPWTTDKGEERISHKQSCYLFLTDDPLEAVRRDIRLKHAGDELPEGDYTLLPEALGIKDGATTIRLAPDLLRRVNITGKAA